MLKNLQNIRLFVGLPILLLYLMLQWGYPGVFLAQLSALKKAAKMEMFSTLPEQDLVRVAESKDLVWIEEGREFYFHDVLYDVVKTVEISGQKHYYAVNDEKESSLLEKNRQVVENNSSGKKQKEAAHSLLKFKQLVFTLSQHNEGKFSLPILSCALLMQRSALLPLHSEVLTPPPRRLSC